MWAYVEWVNIPYFEQQSQSTNSVQDTTKGASGNHSDLYPYWYGTRELLLHGRDPYSVQVTQDIQRGFYGRVLDPNDPNEKEQEAFAYPAYTVFLLAPLIFTSFDTLQSWFGLFLLVLTAASVPLWLVALRIRLDWPRTIALALFAATSFGVLQAIGWLQLSLVIGLISALGIALLVNRHYFLAGSVMAVATIKPQLVALLLIGLLLWSLFSWRRRQCFVWGFLASMVVLTLGAELLSPGWIPKFIAGISDYQQYTGYEPLLTRMFGGAGAALGLALIIGVVWLWVKAGREKEPGAMFDFALAAALALPTLVVPMILWYNQMLLFPALFLLIRHAGQVFTQGARIPRYLFFTVAFVVVWQWIAALLLTIWYALTLATGTSVDMVVNAWFLPLLGLYLAPIAVPIGLITALWAKSRPQAPGEGLPRHVSAITPC